MVAAIQIYVRIAGREIERNACLSCLNPATALVLRFRRVPLPFDAKFRSMACSIPLMSSFGNLAGVTSQVGALPQPCVRFYEVGGSSRWMEISFSSASDWVMHTTLRVHQRLAIYLRAGAMAVFIIYRSEGRDKDKDSSFV